MTFFIWSYIEIVFKYLKTVLITYLRSLMIMFLWTVRANLHKATSLNFSLYITIYLPILKFIFNLMKLHHRYRITFSIFTILIFIQFLHSDVFRFFNRVMLMFLHLFTGTLRYLLFMSHWLWRLWKFREFLCGLFETGILNILIKVS